SGHGTCRRRARRAPGIGLGAFSCPRFSTGATKGGCFCARPLLHCDDTDNHGTPMNWISNVVRPKIRSFLNRRDTPENLWIKCPETGQLVFYKDVEANSFVIPGSDYHMRMGATARM